MVAPPTVSYRHRGPKSRSFSLRCDHRTHSTEFRTSAPSRWIRLDRLVAPKYLNLNAEKKDFSRRTKAPANVIVWRVKCGVAPRRRGRLCETPCVQTRLHNCNRIERGNPQADTYVYVYTRMCNSRTWRVFLSVAGRGREQRRLSTKNGRTEQRGTVTTRIQLGGCYELRERAWQWCDLWKNYGRDRNQLP